MTQTRSLGYQPPQDKANSNRDSGAVTAEFAVILPAVIFVLALLMGAAACGITQIKLEESARLGARAAARGENTETVERIAGEVEDGITVGISNSGSTVTVSTSRQAPGLIGNITGWQLSAKATVPHEPASRLVTEDG